MEAQILSQPYKRTRDGRWVMRIQCEACGETVETRRDHIQKRLRERIPLYCASCSRKRTYVEKTICTDLEDWQWAYIAGFLDGEGCLTWPRHSRGTAPQISIAQVDRAPLDTIAEWLGTGTFTLDERSKENEDWQDCWRMRLTNCIDILSLLMHIHKYLLVKRNWLPEMVEYLDQRIGLNGYEGMLERARSILSE